MKIKKILTLLVLLVVLVCVAAVDTTELARRDHRLYHLSVAPTATAVSSNILELLSGDRTNGLILTTNMAPCGPGGANGPRLAMRNGTNIYFAVTNRQTISTNLAGAAITNTWRNGLLTEQ